jgi:hypothetical protein
MRNLRNLALPAVALLAGLTLAPGAAVAVAVAVAETSVVALFPAGQPVTVNVGFNAEVPLADAASGGE